jgi:hypothetical protein
MRLPSIVLALCAAGLSTTARAEELPYTLSGIIEGSRDIWTCDLDEYPYCGFHSSSFSQSFAFTLFWDLDPGLNEFHYGSPHSGFGVYEGTILDEGGNLSGLNLFWGTTGCFPEPREGCVELTGTAPTFTVQRGNAVPEPSTWLLMLVGFGLAGYWLRELSARSSRGEQLVGRTSKATQIEGVDLPVG